MHTVFVWNVANDVFGDFMTTLRSTTFFMSMHIQMSCLNDYQKQQQIKNEDGHICFYQHQPVPI